MYSDLDIACSKKLEQRWDWEPRAEYISLMIAESPLWQFLCLPLPVPVPLEQVGGQNFLPAFHGLSPRQGLSPLVWLAYVQTVKVKEAFSVHIFWTNL